jgi:trk system potassium uptake protein TrkA
MKRGKNMLEIKRNNRPKGLKIIIVGCGKVGMTIMERLSKEGHDISVIDKNPTRIQNAVNTYDVFGIVGNGASFTVQTEAGIEQADILISVTDSDELNLLCCLVAKRAGHCEVIARVRTPDYSEEAAYLKEKLGLAMIINPEQEAANAISRILYIPTALSVNPFARGQAEMVRIKLPTGNVLAGKRIADLGQQLSGAVLICAVERDGEVYIPDGSVELAAGDVITFISPVRDGRKFLKRIGFQTHQVKNTIIIGGGRAAYYLAKRLIALNVSVTIVEAKKDRCEELSVLLPQAVIINGDGTDEELLNEIGIESAESVVALTGIDEENILLSLHARDVSDAKVITKINRITFKRVINSMDLGSVVYPKYITSEAIVAFVRAKTASKDSNIETMLHLYDNRVEAIEFLVGEGAPVVGIPLYKLPLKDHLLITCINRGGKILIPGGNDEIQTGDSVIIVTTHSGLYDVRDILK